MIEQQYYKQISTNGVKVILIVLKNAKYSTVPPSMISNSHNMLNTALTNTTVDEQFCLTKTMPKDKIAAPLPDGWQIHSGPRNSSPTVLFIPGISWIYSPATNTATNTTSFYYVRSYINQMQTWLLWNPRDIVYINNSGATSMTYPYAFTTLEKHQCPSSKEKPLWVSADKTRVTLYIAIGLMSLQLLSQSDLKGQKYVRTVKQPQ